ncbi:hypothetical protein [Eoetvoesiella caeni]
MKQYDDNEPFFITEEVDVARQLSWPVRVNYLGRLTLGNLLG